MFHSTGTPGASAVSRPLPTSLVLPISLEELREAAAALRCCTMLEVTSWEHHDQGKGRAKASAWLKSQTTDVSPLQGPFWCELPWDYQAVTVLKQNSLSHREAWTRAEELLVQLLALGGLSLDFFFFFSPSNSFISKNVSCGLYIYPWKCWFSVMVSVKYHWCYLAIPVSGGLGQRARGKNPVLGLSRVSWIYVIMPVSYICYYGSALTHFTYRYSPLCKSLLQVKC